MFATIGGLWLTIIFILWCGACIHDSIYKGKVQLIENTFQAVLLGGIPVLIFKFFIFILS